jgi:hypothetical protein
MLPVGWGFPGKVLTLSLGEKGCVDVRWKRGVTEVAATAYMDHRIHGQVGNKPSDEDRKGGRCWMSALLFWGLLPVLHVSLSPAVSAINIHPTPHFSVSLFQYFCGCNRYGQRQPCKSIHSSFGAHPPTLTFNAAAATSFLGACAYLVLAPCAQVWPRVKITERVAAACKAFFGKS